MTDQTMTPEQALARMFERLDAIDGNFEWTQERDIIRAALSRPAVPAVPAELAELLDRLSPPGHGIAMKGDPTEAFHTGHDIYLAQRVKAWLHNQAPAPAVPEGVIRDAASHLTDWLDMNWCECEGDHTCGRNNVVRTRDQLLQLLAAAPAEESSADAGEPRRFETPQEFVQWLRSVRAYGSDAEDTWGAAEVAAQAVEGMLEQRQLRPNCGSDIVYEDRADQGKGVKHCDDCGHEFPNPVYVEQEQPEDGPVAWMVDYGDGSDPEVYEGKRPPGVAVECSVAPLYPESVKAERDALRAENAELRERVRELEADAARYRWLRGECESPNGGLTIASVTEWGLEGWSGDDPDNRIDAAMQEGKS